MLGTFWEYLGMSWDYHKTMLGTFWEYLGMSWDYQQFLLSNDIPSDSPNWEHLGILFLFITSTPRCSGKVPVPWKLPNGNGASHLTKHHIISKKVLV
jgi:hypothetical protein